MTVLITLTLAGADTGPFSLYSDVDGFLAPFETGVSKLALEAGYTSVVVPNGSTIIRVQSNSACTNYIDLYISGITTTTTSTSTSTTSTTTSVAPPTVYSYIVKMSTSEVGTCSMGEETVFSSSSTFGTGMVLYADIDLTIEINTNSEGYNYVLYVSANDIYEFMTNTGGTVAADTTLGC